MRTCFQQVPMLVGTCSIQFHREQKFYVPNVSISKYKNLSFLLYVSDEIEFNCDKSDKNIKSDSMQFCY